MVAERVASTWRAIRAAVSGPDDKIAEQARREAPVVWLVGKVQSGKTSIVHAITGHPAAEIGAGYKPCTKTARVFDFPDDAPVIRFLDTTGLGEVGYDPAADVAELERKAHVVLAVARAMDNAQHELLDVLRAVRSRHPDWAVVLAQTTLHEGYPRGGDHPLYEDLGGAPGLEDLRRSLALQAAAFQALPGRGAVHCVPIDFTPPEEGFNDPHFGLGALLDALEHAGSSGMAAILESLRARDYDARAARARPHILGYALAAGASDVVPLIGWVSVPTIQGKMLHTIARIYGLHWDTRTIGRFAASLGTGTVMRIGIGFGARQLGKLVPGYGQTVGAAAAGATSFAVTYALGRAACYFLRVAKVGRVDADGVARVYRESLREAFDIVRARRSPARELGDGRGSP
jgi:uncharacterized protein (DUF697 family)